MSDTETKTPVDPAEKAIEGENQDRTLHQQIELARGKEETKEDKGGKVDSKVTAAAKAATTPEMELRDAAKDAREEHLRSLGIDPSNPSGIKKVEPSGTKNKMYKGMVTVTGESGEFHQKISARIDLGATPRGEAWIRDHAFKEHFPSFDRDAGIKIDPENKDDPALRTSFD